MNNAKRGLMDSLHKTEFSRRFFPPARPLFRRHPTPENEKIPRYTEKTPTKAKTATKRQPPR